MKLPSQASMKTAGDVVTEAVAVGCSPELASSLVSQVPHCTSAEGGTPAAFIAAAAFSGAKTGMLFHMGDQGLGYYPDASLAEAQLRSKASRPGKEPNGVCSHADVDPQTTDSSVAASTDSVASPTDGVSAGLSSNTSNVEGAILPSATVMASKQKQVEELRTDAADEGGVLPETHGQLKGQGLGEETEVGGGKATGHYWGQALQYLDRSVQVC